MATRMVIDARHPEETRVAVLKGNRIEEFDFESADKKQIKGNIYLAKVTRVEPSLQAAFVDFGGNRHGFLAFSEIHPDYYQIPKEDREALLAEEAAHAEEEAALRAVEDGDDQDDVDGYDQDASEDDDLDGYGGGVTEVDTSNSDHVSTIEAGHVENGDDDNGDSDGDDANAAGSAAEGDNGGSSEDDSGRDRSRRRGRRQGGRGRSKEADDLRARRMALRRRYKIQDVIHRRQVLLVQVVKEERGNKGAALTTYLSLAGRYCVLMPNSSHGGGISRKISSASDRKRLKAIVNELALPKTMGCIVRTAGLSRTKTEIKRDFDYLARLWDELRERTLKSSAPALIHSDSDLIKRAIRDIYNRDIDEVIVEGEDGYRAAKDFMKLLMPSHARRVKPYADPVPLFQRYGAEDQLSAMYDPVVQLRSGGYIVINPTEALVSIDINSGRATKEHGIEATAVNTNLEAAHEIARQLRLRDMAGLVVIDFIDMEYGSNIRKVEKAMKESLKNDRARIQVGRISSFGLMEMSRQRLRTGVLEATTRECPHCDGTGLVRTASSAGLSALRLIEDEAAKGKGSLITLYASTEAAVYLLNSKRANLAEIEALYGVSVEVIPEGENEGAKMRVSSSGQRLESVPTFVPIIDEIEDEDEPEVEDDYADEEEAEADGGSRRKRRRRRRGRNRDGDNGQTARDTEFQESGSDSEEESQDQSDTEATADASGDEDAPKKRRRRGGRRRRGRGRNGEAEGQIEAEGTEGDGYAEAAEGSGFAEIAEDTSFTEVAYVDVPDAGQPFSDEPVADAPVIESTPPAEPAGETAEAGEPVEPAPKPRTRRRKKVTEEAPEAAEATTDGASPVEATEEAPPAKPKRTRRKKAEPAEVAEGAEAASTEEAPAKPKRTRRKKAEPAEAAEGADAPVTEEAPAKPKRTRRKKAEAPADDALTGEDQVAIEPHRVVEPEPMGSSEPVEDEIVSSTNAAGAESSEGTPRRGWWQRTFGD